jgi:small-conductance mechanosensitive channel
MQTEYPFSKLFGRADSRDACTASSASVYEKLVTCQDGENMNLKFATLAEIATNNTGQINQKKLKRLLDVFRPNKDKELNMLDFTRVSTNVELTSAVLGFLQFLIFRCLFGKYQCVDCVYRELRTLSAGIGNATAIERVFEMMLNFVFYFILMFVCLALVGVDALAFGVTVIGWILALSFVIGTACSSTFEGIIMILARRPYGKCLGDCIDFCCS